MAKIQTKKKKERIKSYEKEGYETVHQTDLVSWIYYGNDAGSAVCGIQDSVQCGRVGSSGDIFIELQYFLCGIADLGRAQHDLFCGIGSAFHPQGLSGTHFCDA
jgi:hypothetical protein